VKIWLDVLRSEESSVELIAENVSKMLELVSGHRHRVIFLKILVDKVRCHDFYQPIFIYISNSVQCCYIYCENLDTFLSE